MAFALEDLYLNLCAGASISGAKRFAFSPLPRAGVKKAFDIADLRRMEGQTASWPPGFNARSAPINPLKTRPSFRFIHSKCAAPEILRVAGWELTRPFEPRQNSPLPDPQASALLVMRERPSRGAHKWPVGDAATGAFLAVLKEDITIISSSASLTDLSAPRGPFLAMRMSSARRA